MRLVCAAGSFPITFRNVTTCRLQSIAMTNCLLTGNLDNLLITDHMHYVVLNSNHISSIVPVDWFEHSNQLESLPLLHNSLSGTLPQVTGTPRCLADTVGSCSVFPCDALRNAICSESKKCMCTDGSCVVNGVCQRGGQQSIASLIQMEFSLNKLSGTLESSLCNLTAVEQLNLESLSLSGVLPPCLSGLTGMSTFAVRQYTTDHRRKYRQWHSST